VNDCCDIDGAAEGGATSTIGTNITACVACGMQGWPIKRQTILHHLKHERFDRVNEEAYRFCPERNCEVVYYSNCGTKFGVNDLREPVGAKLIGDIRPICYCFGITEGDVRKQISQTGHTTIATTISSLIKVGMCACEIRNPSGMCCLGDLNQLIKRLTIDDA
jgi:hypothetical protein